MASICRAQIIVYRHPGRERTIIGRALCIEYEWSVIETNMRHRLERGALPARQGLASQIDDAMKSKGAAYVNKVRSTNVRKLSESIAFLQEAGFADRGELEDALSMSSASLAAAKESLEATESALKRANRAIRASGTYLSNQAVWRDYRPSPDRKAFYIAHRCELEACNSARKELKELFPEGRAPSVNELKAERDKLVLERNARYESWVDERYRHRELEAAKRNVDAILGARGEAVAVLGGGRSRRDGGELE